MIHTGVHVVGGGVWSKARAIQEYSLLIRYISSVGRAIDF
nr:MAG TPA_asm: hypothetical protein [Bacteriophage sp.]